MKIIVKTVSLIALSVVALALLSGTEVLAQADEVKRGLDSISGDNVISFDNAIESVVKTLLFIIGAASVVMIIYGGFRYVTSAGEASAVKSAKDTIMYAVVGLVIALVAWGIADFVINALTGSTTPSTSETSGQSEENARDAAPQGSPSQFRDNRGVIIE